MEIISKLSQLHKFSKPCVIALGTFDGLHKGHLDIIEAARAEAQKQDAMLAVFTFQNHPASFINPRLAPPALLSLKERQIALAHLGVDVLIEVPFDEELCSLTPEEFVEKLSQVGFSCLVIGENFTYGYKGSGNKESLARSADARGFKLITRSLVTEETSTVSSTLIRKQITSGEVAEAAKLLQRNYTLTGKVAHGQARGRTIDFPTANLELVDMHLAIPAVGVYAVNVEVGGKIYQGMANIGDNPTFGDVQNKRLEVNIFDFHEDIYEQEITVAFVKRIRGEIKFASAEELKKQLEKDKNICFHKF
ncbi:MAG: bifunctional riboflavin kinase/FAD synthetase [Phascolarctobacterium sp.]|nr:bifunctional riboflavin kinase/FAD synthetase [Phascolarctobacterium sp.]